MQEQKYDLAYLCVNVAHEREFLAANACQIIDSCYAAARTRDAGATTVIVVEPLAYTETDLHEMALELEVSKVALKKAHDVFKAQTNLNLDRAVNLILSGARGMTLAADIYSNLAELVETSAEILVDSGKYVRGLLNQKMIYSTLSYLILRITEEHKLTTRIANIDLDFANNVGPRYVRCKINKIIAHSDVSEATKKELKKIARAGYPLSQTSIADFIAQYWTL